MPKARQREAIVPAKMKIVVKELLDQRVYIWPRLPRVGRRGSSTIGKTPYRA